jgi:hypothetical protein
MVMFAQPRFEVRCHENNEWHEISEIEIMDGLYKICKKVTPVIKEMIKGKEVQTPDGLFRLKFSPES